MLIERTRTHIISYVCTWELLLLISHWNISFPSRYNGSRWSVRFFFSVSITCAATGRSLVDTKRKREKSRVWHFEVRVMLLLDRPRARIILTGIRYTIVSCGWPHYSIISQLSGVFCNKLTADAGWRRILQKKMKTSAVSTTDWVVETQLCKLRGTLNTLVGRAYSIFHS